MSAGLLGAAQLLVGPAGVWLGWWLAQRTADARVERLEGRLERSATTDRVVLGIRQLTGTTERLIALGQAAHMRGHGRSVNEKQHSDTVAEFNAELDAARGSAISAGVLGPAWFRDEMLPLLSDLQDGIRLVHKMQARFTDADSKRFQDLCGELRSSLRGLEDTARSTLAEDRQ